MCVLVLSLQKYCDTFYKSHHLITRINLTDKNLKSTAGHMPHNGHVVTLYIAASRLNANAYMEPRQRVSSNQQYASGWPNRCFLLQAFVLRHIIWMTCSATVINIDRNCNYYTATKFYIERVLQLSLHLHQIINQLNWNQSS